MNVDKYVEENPQRFEMIGKACRALSIEGTAISKASLSSALPLDFCLDDNDPWRMIAAEAQRAVADGMMTATEAPDTAAPVKVSTGPVDTRESLASKKLDL